MPFLGQRCLTIWPGTTTDGLTRQRQQTDAAGVVRQLGRRPGASPSVCPEPVVRVARPRWVIRTTRTMRDRADAAPTRARWQFWTSVVTAILICIGLELYPTYDRSSHHESSGPYHAYAGHRWYLQLPTSSAGYIELGDAGVFHTYDTAVAFFGTYVITGTGRLVVHWTGGVSTGTPPL